MVAKELRSDIQSALPKGKVPWGYDFVIDALPGLLGSEQVRGIAMGQDDGKFAVLVLAQSRVTLLRSTMFGRVSTEDLLLAAITSVEQKKGMMSTVTLHASGNDLELRVVDNGEAANFVAAVRSAIDQAKTSTSSTPSPPVAAAPSRRSSEQIKQAIRDLAELRDEGLLTTAQFEEKKAALLAEM